ncbi:MAG: hypothetical protein ACKOYI_10625 [Actinomycetota bacterium]
MRRVEFRSPAKADVAVLSRNLELWPVLREVVDGWGVVEIETIQSPIGLLDTPRILRTMRGQGTTLGYASMAARIRRSGAKVLLAVDQTSEVIEELGRLLPETHQVLIAHGSLRADHLSMHSITRRENRVLCTWGDSDIEIYRTLGDAAVECRAVGSMRNAGYVRLHPLAKQRSVQHQLLLISQYSGADEEEAGSPRKRDQILRTLKSHVRQYCLARNVSLTVALRPPVSAPYAPGQVDAERRHYERVFEGLRLNFTDPSKAYSTYLASDESDVTIGVPSGGLTESFGRGNKVLMIRQTPTLGTYYGFPVEGDWLLTEPDYDQFATRLDTLRNSRREDLATQWRQAREYVVANAETDAPISLVRDLIAQALNRAT